jgi:hypothetical protein
MNGAGRPEIRNPRSEIRRKLEIRRHSVRDCRAVALGEDRFGFRPSDFLRISEFGFRIYPKPNRLEISHEVV